MSGTAGRDASSQNFACMGMTTTNHSAHGAVNAKANPSFSTGLMRYKYDLDCADFNGKHVSENGVNFLSKSTSHLPSCAVSNKCTSDGRMGLLSASLSNYPSLASSAYLHDNAGMLASSASHACARDGTNTMHESHQYSAHMPQETQQTKRFLSTSLPSSALQRFSYSGASEAGCFQESQGNGFERRSNVSLSNSTSSYSVGPQAPTLLGGDKIERAVNQVVRRYLFVPVAGG